MSLQMPADVEASVRAFVASGHYASEEEVLRKALAALQHEESVSMIKEGIADLEAGRYRPFEEVDAEIRQRFGFKAS